MTVVFPFAAIVKLGEDLKPVFEFESSGPMGVRGLGYSVGFAYVDGNALLMNLRDVAVSSGSACTSADPEPTSRPPAYTSRYSSNAGPYPSKESAC